MNSCCPIVNTSTLDDWRPSRSFLMSSMPAINRTHGALPCVIHNTKVCCKAVAVSTESKGEVNTFLWCCRSKVPVSAKKRNVMERLTSHIKQAFLSPTEDEASSSSAKNFDVNTCVGPLSRYSECVGQTWWGKLNTPWRKQLMFQQDVFSNHWKGNNHESYLVSCTLAKTLWRIRILQTSVVCAAEDMACSCVPTISYTLRWMTFSFIARGVAISMRFSNQTFFSALTATAYCKAYFDQFFIYNRKSWHHYNHWALWSIFSQSHKHHPAVGNAH